MYHRVHLLLRVLHFLHFLRVHRFRQYQLHVDNNDRYDVLHANHNLNDVQVCNDVCVLPTNHDNDDDDGVHLMTRDNAMMDDSDDDGILRMNGDLVYNNVLQKMNRDSGVAVAVGVAVVMAMVFLLDKS